MSSLWRASRSCVVMAALICLLMPRMAHALESCCFTDGACMELEPSACGIAGGAAQGPGSTCPTSNCAAQWGACCIGTPFGTTCVELDSTTCVERSGGFAGIGTLCSGSDCNSARACCLTDGTCQNLVPPLCGQRGGTPQPMGSACASVTCVRTEACCMPELQGCRDLVASDCNAIRGSRQGPGSRCTTATCPLVTEACCFPDTTCLNLDLAACDVQGGLLQGLGSDCATASCPLELGACCIATPFGYSCRDDGPTQCGADGGVFLGIGTRCATAPCSSVQACCSAGNPCRDLAAVDCVMGGGTPKGAGTNCASTSCVVVPLPGEVPNGTTERPGVPLWVRKGIVAPDLALSWSLSCSAEAIEYTVHEGSLGAWYSHAALLCDTSGALVSATITPGSGGRYFLVVPVTATAEGSYGVDSNGVERPVSVTTCFPTQVLGCF